MMQEEGDDIELTYKNGGCAKENLSDEDDYLSNDKDSLGGYIHCYIIRHE